MKSGKKFSGNFGFCLFVFFSSSSFPSFLIKNLGGLKERGLSQLTIKRKKKKKI